MSPSGHPESLTARALRPVAPNIRDSKHPDRGHLPFPAAEWDAFLTAARLPRA